ncbi:acetylglutamate kinase [Fusibacter paucivorans]|uniref:Acetylglutamate kinase n=2 Tax=Fusibacter paucivorans TaxID=76009 RepID=A0ABS5PKB4_9FIRM|nr:acetylglutamate kinase [Fusibacter paucivorans]
MEGGDQIMDKVIDKAKILIEALPYINAFKGKIFVIKYGGSAMTDERLKSQVLRDVSLLKSVGIRPVIVHGGGKEITALLKEVGKPSHFVDGIRATTAEEIEYVEMMLSGKINKSVVATLMQNECEAVGISGRDGGLLKTVPFDASQPAFERVGLVTEVNAKVIETLLEAQFVPVISPIGADAEGNAFNVNADEAAAAVAGALKAEKLIMLTDVDGVLNGKALISEITMKQAETLIAEGVITGGMIPKIECCIKSDVENVHILNGTLDHAILLEIFTQRGVGTKIFK